jgi:drug/metabolite transporter (DMT)-like permease
MSDPVTPAIAAAMMPIAGAAVEVVFDKRRLRLHLLLAIVLAFAGGLLAGGVNLSNGTFGLGYVFCVVAIFLFAWVTRAATHDFQSLSSIGQTTITLVGCLFVVIILYGACFITGLGEIHVGSLDSVSLILLFGMAIASIAVGQLLWIWGAGGLGVLFASLHMNVAPFYVMAIVVVFMGEQWVWGQAFGAALVGVGVLVAQSPNWRAQAKL